MNTSTLENLQEKARPKKASAKSNFLKLKRRLGDDNTKVVLSLGSGGVRMFAHSAVLRFLEQIGAQQQITEIWGSSGGAIVGLCYALGMSPDEIDTRGLSLLNKKSTFQIIPPLSSITRKMMIEKYLTRKSRNMIRGFHDVQANIKDFMGDIDQNQILRPFYCLAYNTEKHEIDILTPPQSGNGLDPSWMYQADPLDIVMASSAIPIMFVPKVIEDGHKKRVYADGGTFEEVPTASVYRKWMHDKSEGREKRKRLLVIAVTLGAFYSSLGLFENWLVQQLPAFEYLAIMAQYADSMREARTKAQMQVLHNDPNVEVWQIPLEMNINVLDVKKIPEVIRFGKRHVPKLFRKISESLS